MKLKEKIKQEIGKKGKYIETIRGIGYKFEIKSWKIITILAMLKFYLKMLMYYMYTPLFSWNFAVPKFNSFPTKKLE